MVPFGFLLGLPLRQHLINPLPHERPRIETIRPFHQQCVVVGMHMAHMGSDGQFHGQRIQSPSGSRTADASTTALSGVLRNLPGFGRRAAGELGFDGLGEFFDELLVFGLALDAGKLPGALTFRGIGDAFLFGFLQGIRGHEQPGARSVCERG